jgi:hypothetical protein
MGHTPKTKKVIRKAMGAFYLLEAYYFYKPDNAGGYESDN